MKSSAAYRLVVSAIAGLVLGSCSTAQHPAAANLNHSSHSATQPTTAPATQTAEAPPPPLVLGQSTVLTADISYSPGSDSPLQKLNVYAPRAAQNAPVVIFIHGGGWTHGDRAVAGSQPRLFNDAGIILVSIDYRVSPAVQHPAHIQDVAAALAWVKNNIQSYGGDPSNIFVMGHSAGSQMAALVAVDGRYLQKHQLKLSDVRGAIMLDGSAFDIPDRIARGGEKLAENCRRAFGTDPVVQADASPVNHIAAGKGIAPFLFVYVKEGSLNHDQTKAMVQRLQTAQTTAEIHFVPGKTHALLCDELGLPGDRASDMIVQFVRDQSKRTRSTPSN